MMTCWCCEKKKPDVRLCQFQAGDPEQWIEGMFCKTCCIDPIYEEEEE